MRTKRDEEKRGRPAPERKRDPVPVSKPTEQHEIEAREMAEPPSAIRGTTSCSTCAMGGSCPTCARRYVRPAGLVPDSGEPLSGALRAQVELRVGPVGDVHIHTGPAAAAAAERLDARAYAFGRSIVFGQDAYAPETVAGMQLLVHEIRHTQQDPEGEMVHRQPTGREGTAWKPPAWFPLPTEVPEPPPCLAHLHRGLDAYVDRRVRFFADEIGPIEQIERDYTVLPYDYSQPLEIPVRSWDELTSVQWDVLEEAPQPTLFRQGKRLAGGYTLSYITSGNVIVLERDGIGYLMDGAVFSWLFGHDFPEVYRELEEYPRWAHENPIKALIGNIAAQMMSPENMWMSLPFMFAMPFFGEVAAIRPGVSGGGFSAPEVGMGEIASTPEMRAATGGTAAEARAASSATAAEGRVAGSTAAVEGRVAPKPSPIPEIAPPTQADIAAMHQLDTGPALKKAAEFAQHPGTVYHHNIGKGGTRAIVESNTMLGGEGTASFGGGTSVRAWFGEAPVSPASPRTSPTIEFTVPGERPDVRLYAGGTPGAKWNVDELTISVRKVYFPDGRIAVPETAGYYKVTAPDGTVTRMHVSEFPK